MACARGLPSNSLSAIGVVRHDLRDGGHGLHIPGRRRIPWGQLQDCHGKGAGCLPRDTRAPACAIQIRGSPLSARNHYGTESMLARAGRFHRWELGCHSPNMVHRIVRVVWERT
jgi:hypothetical protein